MAVKLYEQVGLNKKYMCTTADTKPTAAEGARLGDTLMEYDAATKELTAIYLFDESDWIKL